MLEQKDLFQYAILAVIGIIMAGVSSFLLPQGLVGCSLILTMVVLFALFLMWYRFEGATRDIGAIRRLLEQHFGPLKQEIASPGFVYTRCRWAVTKKMEDLNDVRRIYVGCSQNLMSTGGCPEKCATYGEPPKPSGVGAFGGMGTGALIGLLGGPIGVFLGGLIGGLVGHGIELSSLSPQIEARLSDCRAIGKRPELIVEV